jgi:hypothetical protein
MVTARDICRITGKKKAAVSLFLSRNEIKPQSINGKLKFYDESAEPLASYLGSGNGSAAAAGRKPARKHGSGAGAAAAQEPVRGIASKERVVESNELILNEVFSGNIARAPSGAKMLAGAYQEANAAEDYGAKIKIASMLIKEYEMERVKEHERIIFEAKQRKAEAEAERIKIENEMRRGELVSREEVKQAWGRMCAVVTSQIHPVGIKLAPQVCAAVDAVDPESRLKVQALIDKEIYAACENVKRELGVID